MKTKLNLRKMPALASLLLFLFGTAAGCAGENVVYPKTPAALHLDTAGRAAFREGFLAGHQDDEAHLSADHRRHPFPPQYEDAFRCGYIRGLTYTWFSFGKEARIKKEYPAYLNAYEKQFVHW
jgi:hypothetical protein